MDRRRSFDDERTVFEVIVRQLVDAGLLIPLGDDDADAQLWMDCELCSYVGNRFHRQVEPSSLTPGERTEWERRAVTSDERIRDPRQWEFDTAFWLVERGIRVGTIALAAMWGRQCLPVYSLYVFPAHRGTGIAYRALREIEQAALGLGLAGIRISTFWTWQDAVRRYLMRYGMWAWSFKRSIDFVWHRDLPRYTVTVDSDCARFAVCHEARSSELITAAREGELLRWNELTTMVSEELDGVIRFYARSTFAVALAVRGWPLLRAGDDLDAAAVGDIGGPDVLAYKIAIFEALDRQQGFDVRAPRIPRLPYEQIARRLGMDDASLDAPDPHGRDGTE